MIPEFPRSADAGQVWGIEGQIFQVTTVVPKAVDEDGQWSLKAVPELEVRGARMCFYEIHRTAGSFGGRVGLTQFGSLWASMDRDATRKAWIVPDPDIG